MFFIPERAHFCAECGPSFQAPFSPNKSPNKCRFFGVSRRLDGSTFRLAGTVAKWMNRGNGLKSRNGRFSRGGNRLTIDGRVLVFRSTVVKAVRRDGLTGVIEAGDGFRIGWLVGFRFCGAEASGLSSDETHL